MTAPAASALRRLATRDAWVLAVLLLATLGASRGAETPASGTAAPPAPHAATYKIDEAASTAGFTLGATMHTVTGTGGKVTGELTLEASGPGHWKVGGEVRVEAGSIGTGNIKRDLKMHNSTLEVTRFPLFRFIPATAEGALPEGLRGQAGPFPVTLTGKLEIRGVAREISLTAQVSTRGSRLVVDGTFPVSYLDWGVPDPSVFVLRVDKVVVATFHLEAIPTGG
jgi:polyisoprenoid-binding protein YceI